MPDIFNYLDYREYLEDFYHEKKLANPHFSFQLFAEQAGFQSKSFIKLVITGKKNLGDDSLEQLNGALKLNEKAFAYFKDLVFFNQAKSRQIKNIYLEKLMAVHKGNPSRLIMMHEYDFLSKWYQLTIRELITALDFKGDYEALGKLVKPAISERKARQAVEVLVNLGLIRKKNEGGFELVDKALTTGDEVRSLAVQNLHLQNMTLASQAIDTVKSTERDISSLVLGLSDDSFAKVKQMIQKFRKNLLQIAQEEKCVNRVYHVQFNLFPTSEKIHD